MEAILWDGNKQIKGELLFEEFHIVFLMSDFFQTHLNFRIAYSDIQQVKNVKVFNIARGGVEIISHKGQHSVFVVENAGDLKYQINKMIQYETK